MDLTMVDNRKGFKGLQEEKCKVRLIRALVLLQIKKWRLGFPSRHGPNPKGC